MDTENKYRLFFYITISVVAGLLLIIATQAFLGYINIPGWPGLAVLLAYGFLYLNTAYLINRRFTQKRPAPSRLSYLLAGILVFPALIWISTIDTNMSDGRLLLSLILVFAAFLGAYFGIRAGVKRRRQYLDMKSTPSNSDSKLQ